MSVPAFHRIAQRGNREEVKKNISSANPDERDGDKQTALHVAAQQPNVDIVKILVSKKWDVNAQDSNGWTPLHCAADRALLKNCEVLLQSKNIDVNILNNDQTSALVYLVRQNPAQLKEEELELYTHVMSVMVERGAIVNTINRHGESALHSAVLRGNVHSIRFLLNSEADVNILNTKKETSLHWAVRIGKLDVVKTLIEYGGDPFLASGKGDTAMELAISGKKEDIISLMTSMAQTCEKAMADAYRVGWLHHYMPRQKQWERQFFVLKENMLLYYRSAERDEKPLGCLDMKTSEVKEKISRDKVDKGFCFNLMGVQGRCLMLAADSEKEVNDWIDDFRRFNEEQPSKLQTEVQHDAILDENMNPRAHLQSLLEMPDNQACAECGETNPTFVSPKLGTFVCYQCGLTYSKHGISPIKSVYFDQWELSEVMFLKCNGNERSNQKWECYVPLGYIKPSPNCTVSIREAFIKAKYLHKKFVEQSFPKELISLNLVMAERAANFQVDHDLVLQEMLISQVGITYTRLKILVDNSKHFELICLLLRYETSDTSVGAGLSRLIEDATATIGKNHKLIRDIVELGRIGGILLLKQIEVPRKKISDRLRTFLQEYLDVQEEIFDSQTEAICRWWMPQSLEILAIGLAVVANQKQLNITADGVVQLRKMFEVFQRNSGLAIWLLLGCHLNDDDFDNEIKRQASGLQLKLEENLVSSIKAYKTALEESLISVQAGHQHERARRTKKMGNKQRKGQPNSTSQNVSQGSLTYSEPTSSPRSPRHEDVPSGVFMPGFSTPTALRLLTEDTPLQNILADLMDEFPLGMPETLLGVDTSSWTRTFFPPLKSIHARTQSPVFGAEGNALISRIQNLLQILNQLRKCWVYQKATLPYSILHRQILILRCHVQYLSLSEEELPFSVPEAWKSWLQMRQILEQIVSFIAISSKKSFDPQTLCPLLQEAIVLVRWSMSQLVLVQNTEDNRSDVLM